MRIVIDGMGGDNAPGEVVKGAVEAANVIGDDIYSRQGRYDRS